MLYLLFSLFVVIPDPAFDPMAFEHFKKSGDKAVCLVDYTNKTVECNYKNITECREMYGKDRRVLICFPRKSLKLGEGDYDEQD
jgi:hypothetical protein